VDGDLGQERSDAGQPGEGGAPRTSPPAQSRCLLPTISNPLPISQRRHGNRRSPPTAFVASTGARAGVAGRSGLQVWIDVLREATPRRRVRGAGGLPRPGVLLFVYAPGSREDAARRRPARTAARTVR
jgi:hypothetical protein